MSNLANILTLGRLVLLPFIIAAMFAPSDPFAWLALALYVLGALTDFLDGWVARRFDQVSEFGKFIDPIADKIYVAVILLMLIVIDRVPGLWSIAVMIILTREFVVAGLREFLGPKGVKLPVSRLAKWKTAVQMIATGLLIVAPFVPYGSDAGLYGLALAAVLTVITGYGYLKTSLPHLK